MSVSVSTRFHHGDVSKTPARDRIVSVSVSVAALETPPNLQRAAFYCLTLTREFTAMAFACNYYGVITPSCPLSLNRAPLLTSNYTGVSINSGCRKLGVNTGLFTLGLKAADRMPRAESRDASPLALGSITGL